MREKHRACLLTYQPLLRSPKHCEVPDETFGLSHGRGGQYILSAHCPTHCPVGKNPYEKLMRVGGGSNR